MRKDGAREIAGIFAGTLACAFAASAGDVPGAAHARRMARL